MQFWVFTVNDRENCRWGIEETINIELWIGREKEIV